MYLPRHHNGVVDKKTIPLERSIKALLSHLNLFKVGRYIFTEKIQKRLSLVRFKAGLIISLC